MSSTTLDRLGLWRDLLADQSSSGLTIANWCAKEGVSMNTYYYWRKRVSSPSLGLVPVGTAPISTSLSSIPEWLPFSLTDDSAAASSLTLRVGRVGVEVGSGFDRRLLSDILNVLEAR